MLDNIWHCPSPTVIVVCVNLCVQVALVVPVVLVLVEVVVDRTGQAVLVWDRPVAVSA